MRVELAYGRGSVAVEFPEGRTTVIEPEHCPGLADERTAFHHALTNPISAPPLQRWIKPGDKICIVFTDITRATPNERIIPWLLEHLAGVPAENITLLNALGTHRPNTPQELEQMLGPKVIRRYRVINHEPENAQALVQVGSTGDGTPALLNRTFVESDVRIVTGFIEPHFFAGFSGGPKGIMPGVAGLSTVMSNHGSRNLAHPGATFGVTDGNPLWEELRDIALRVGPSFLVNVTLNSAREITGVFAGDLLAAHKAGCEHARRTSMKACSKPFDAVVTTNSGYPLDLNLYQGVKGLSAATRITKPGGVIVLACECSDGVPAGSHFEKMLQSRESVHALLQRLCQPGVCEAEQWQVQILAQALQGHRVFLYSSLAKETVRRLHVTYCEDIEGLIRTFPDDWQVGVLPQGPLTIPYLARPGAAHGQMGKTPNTPENR